MAIKRHARRTEESPAPLVTHPDGAMHFPNAQEGATFSWWPTFGPEGYLGQLDDNFQARLAEERRFLRPQDCRFYHSADLPSGETVEGAWDLRGREREYLGGVETRGKRVLEMGPSSGYLSFWMERQGAELVAFDAGWDKSIDLLPAPGGETRRLRIDHAKMVSDFSNSWWYLHRAYGSHAKVVYGDIYALPGDLGSFDIATFGCILLHLRSPIAALEQAARRNPHTIVVTEMWSEGPDGLMANTMRPFPNGEGSRWVVWWSISAGAVVQMLKILGYGDCEVTEHTQLHRPGHRTDVAWVEQPMFTVVGHRT